MINSLAEYASEAHRLDPERCVMGVTAVVGANFGDEGKGKIVDALAAEARYVVRFQ